MTDSKDTIAAVPKAEEELENNPVTIPNNEMLIPVKFNKEIKNIPYEKAIELAQKGMKYEMIEENYEMLRALSTEEGKSVSDFLNSLRTDKTEQRKRILTEKCGGDEELALHILELEKASVREDNGFDEVTEYFPEIKTLQMLPTEVTERSRLNNTKLLDEYLRYLLKERLSLKKADAQIKKADQRSLGSLQNKNGAIDPEAAEFLKGLWK